MADEEINELPDTELADLPDLSADDGMELPGGELGADLADLGGADELSLDGGELPSLDQSASMDLGDVSADMGADLGGGDAGAGHTDMGAIATGGVVNGSGQAISAEKIRNLRVKVQAVLGTVPLKISELSNIEKGDLLELDTKISDPISIYANGDMIAKAEIVVTPDNPPRFGLTITEVVSNETTN